MKKRLHIHFLISLLLLCLAEAELSPAGASAFNGKPFAFPEIRGWKQSSEIQTFVPKTLYEYIDGAADLYLAYDFQELVVAEYLNDRKASVTVEIYRHKSSNDAFGIYSQERSPDASYVNLGVQGYLGQNILNCLSGRCYIKLNSYGTGSEDPEVLRLFAGKVLENLGEEGGLPSILSSFPVEGKIKNSEKYIAKNFLGYPFLNSAFTADYDLSGEKFKLFLIECGEKGGCGNVIQNYLRQIKSSDPGVSEKRYTLSDPHHGVVDLCWEGNSIRGILDTKDADLRTRYLNLFWGRLGKTK
jgi:hypothetical protein